MWHLHASTVFRQSWHISQSVLMRIRIRRYGWCIRMRCFICHRFVNLFVFRIDAIGHKYCRTHTKRIRNFPNKCTGLLKILVCRQHLHDSQYSRPVQWPSVHCEMTLNRLDCRTISNKFRAMCMSMGLCRLRFSIFSTLMPVPVPAWQLTLPLHWLERPSYVTLFLKQTVEMQIGRTKWMPGENHTFS